MTGTPLTDDVEILVQQQFMSRDETRAADAEQDASGTRSGAHIQVSTRIKRMLDDHHHVNRLAEDALERVVHGLRDDEPA
jgi:hypothetical protein